MSLADELLADLEDPETEDIANELKEEEIPEEELMETEESHNVDVDVDVKVSETEKICLSLATDMIKGCATLLRR